MKERRVGVRELKSNLSSVLREVKSGRVITITERGQPVGRILPVEMSIEDALKEGVRRGLWAWNGRNGSRHCRSCAPAVASGFPIYYSKTGNDSLSRFQRNCE